MTDPISNNIISTHEAQPPSDNNAEAKEPAHILVVAVFLNPYDWVELSRLELLHSLPRRGGNGTMDWDEFVEYEFSTTKQTILELRAEDIRAAMVQSLDREGVKLVVSIKYEELVEPFRNYDNYIDWPSETSALPGIVGLVEKIQARTGLHPDAYASAAWEKPNERNSNLFWPDPIGCTGHVCFMSLQKRRDDAGYIQFMNVNVDWESEWSIGYPKRSVPKPMVDQIVVLGERHSGAEWLVDKIARCFPDVKVRYGFSRPGKWFQSPPTAPIPKTLVIAVFLNPYDWVELLRQRPINAPTHEGMEWSAFVASPWERKRSDLDNALSDPAAAECSCGFAFDEVVPCRTRRDPLLDSFPLYELRPGDEGAPHANVLELRANKIVNFLSARDFEGVADLVSVRYEDLVRERERANEASPSTLPFPGMAGLLETIRDRTLLVPDMGAGWISDEEYTAEALGVGATNLDPDYVQWMEENVDWNVEMLVGYSP